ncbi:MAG TPA: NADH-quinone oxidoreductase subunit L [Candidatus Binatus sp.]|uniref:NADH-quinone oxidoreductase subunit L n=1 Tax=Candidatus Binatus sp. TaxID=2811406 RepID=UPI002B47A6CB|nr:NADH-quinone oxidoreductase subunit L [Candidatus Binatus sp.]HKN13907.1 NADH-quinone oxidoreductase subunit L [Candidatus Binatus sp.]
MDHPIPVTFIRLIVVLPLIGAAINFLAGAWLQKTFGKHAISLVGCGVVIAAFILGARAFLAMLALPPENRFMLDDLWKWFDVGGLNLDIAFWLDPLSMIMTLIVTGVGGLIHIYSIGYMHDDDGYWRFFGWLNLFTFAMLVLVLGDNLWLMFVGWEGVGLCSFALIGFWYKVQANTTAGNKAFIVNRIGDLAFVIALYSLFAGLQALGHPTLVTREVAQYAPLLAGVPIGFAGFLSGHQLVGFVTLLMFIGATGKSAQIPLYVWLPDAMAGPTPVSALIHAATMVTAGVYMVARLNFLFSMSPFTMGVIALVGGLTALFAATIGVAQTDIKKVLAYSTVSQLGYMFAAVGVGAYAAGVFHLMTHAFFKACLFLGSGSVIHAMGGEQDMRKMGGLRHKMPITFVTFMAATLAISGVPPFAGFMSKDEIIWQAFSHGHTVVWALLLIGAGITVFYMFRQVYMTFFGEFRGTHEQEHHLHESPPSMAYVLVVLGGLSVVGGLVKIPEFIATFKPFETFLDPVFSSEVTRRITEAGIHSHATEAAFGFITFTMVVIGWLVADLMYRQQKIDPARFSQMFDGIPYEWVYNKYYVDEFYDRVVIQPYLFATRALAWFDSNIIDGVVNLAARVIVFLSWLSGLFDHYVVDWLVNFASNMTYNVGGRLRRLQTGSINGYLYGILAAVMLILLARAVARA